MQKEFPYTISQVMDILHIEYKNGRKQQRVICPFCKRKDKTLSVNLETEKFNCFRCGFSGVYGTKLYAHVKGCDTKQLTQKLPMHWASGLLKREAMNQSRKGMSFTMTFHRLPSPQLQKGMMFTKLFSPLFHSCRRINVTCSPVGSEMMKSNF